MLFRSLIFDNMEIVQLQHVIILAANLAEYASAEKLASVSQNANRYRWEETAQMSKWFNRQLDCALLNSYSEHPKARNHANL
jgi:hypothetical protein